MICMPDDLTNRVISKARLRSVTITGDPGFEILEISPDINPASASQHDCVVSRGTDQAHPGLVGLAFINGFALATLAFGFWWTWNHEGLHTALAISAPFTIVLAFSLTFMVLAARQHPTERSNPTS